MAHGGRRDGSGRKSDAEIAAVRSLIDRAVKMSDWLVIFKRLALDAKNPLEKGNNKAAEILINQRFGLPLARVETDGRGLVIPVTHIEVGDSDAGSDRAEGRAVTAEPSSRAKKSVGK